MIWQVLQVVFLCLLNKQVNHSPSAEYLSERENIMSKQKVLNVLVLMALVLSLFGSGNIQTQVQAQSTNGNGNGQATGKITPADRQAAAQRGVEAGLALPAVGTAAMAAPDSVPHYFGPYPNYANSPLRMADALISFTGDGSGAAAIATIDPATGAITGITVTNSGAGYTAPPVVGISSAVVATGAGASAEAVITGAVNALNLVSGGSGYVEPVTVTFTGGGGMGASATAVVSPTGFVSAINLLSSSADFTAATVNIGGDGTGAAASAVVSPIGFVNGLSLDNGGAGYNTASVAFTGDGTGAAATATITPIGYVSDLVLTNGGAGYTVATVTIVGDGLGATADAIIDPVTGSITGFTITNGGSGYTTATVDIAGDGAGATANAAVNTTAGPITALTLTSGGTGYTAAPVVSINGDGSGALATATVDTSHGPITAVNVTNGGAGYTTATVNITGDGAGATADAVVDTTSGAIIGLTLVSGGGGYTSAPTISFSDASGLGVGASATAGISGSVTAVNVITGGSGYITPGLRKFVDGLPGLGSSGVNNLGQYIPVAEADTVSYPGSDYFEIAVVEYSEQMHSDLPPTRLRGYVQLSTAVVPGKMLPLFDADGNAILLPDGSQALAVDDPHYLGPLISATRDKPVRILFRNLLPTGVAGDLFIPVDTTVMGSGMGPNMGGMTEADPQRPMCGALMYDAAGAQLPKNPDCFSENRATLHLHGGISPWISDGTPHQWITPAGENTAYPKGVSVKNVPDMPDPGPGAMTFFYTNQQSARLMFYHDHSWGITRLNVYAGEAAAYLITDPAEQKLVADGIIPADQIPLVVEDKTFVPSTEQLAMQDPLWDEARWGNYGQLWIPHVYMPAQNPGDASGVNQFGRWAYGPWFWPPTSNIDFPPIANPYYDPACNPDVIWCEPPTIPAVPYNSMGMEAFNDTPLVNGTAYPTVTVDPKSYRFRILNAANDRFFNLSLYQADASGTEVALNAAEVAAALLDPAGVFPTPDTLLSPAGPDWIQIGTEGGFLPSPVVIPAQPITWVTDPTVFNAGNVDQHSLLLGPAERADVIVDFSAFAGKTLILYNDAPAAFPARDPRYDYYTGSADLTTTGGAPSVVAGFGPNTRTVMQIKVAAVAPAPAFNLAGLNGAFAHQLDVNGNPAGVFESSQNPIIVGQASYNAAYGENFAAAGPLAGLVQIYDNNIAFDTLSGNVLNMPLEPKAIQDEMGEAFEKEYGRMSGNLGVEAPNAQAGLQQNLVLYPYVNPATEIVDGVELQGLSVTPISSASDGTQIWKITQNGVDTHPIHFHLYEVQLINRVGWDGIIRQPDANELGWKDTVRISPLEDTIVAFRPIIPKIPFGVPDSIRPLNPMMPVGDASIFNSTDVLGNPINPPITNEIVNFGWEYVWHCHILSHEEMDMMRPVTVHVDRSLPGLPVVTYARDEITGVVTLDWQDGTPVIYTDPNTWGGSASEIGYRIERAVVGTNGKPGAYSVIGVNLANLTGYVDTTATLGVNYSYRVVAFNAAGDSTSAAVGATVLPAPKAPTNVAAVLQSGLQIKVTWKDNANNESFFLVERSVDGGPFTLIANPPSGSVAFTDATVSSGHTYQYQVAAANNGGTSAYGMSGIVSVPMPPTAPSNLTGTAVRVSKRASVTLNWVDNATTETGFVIQRATNANFTVGLTNQTVAANTTTVTQTNLYRGVTYFFRIQAVNMGGGSAWSNVFSIITP